MCKAGMAARKGFLRPASLPITHAQTAGSARLRRGFSPCPRTGQASAGISFAGISFQEAGGPMAQTIYVLNGPNLNLLGTREPETYGRATLADVEALCRTTAAKYGFAVEFRQSNHEGELIDAIHEAGATKAAGLLINAGGYTHTSIAIHDALTSVKVPAIEVHISNVFARERFRRHSFIARAAVASLCGFGIDGYALAITGLAAKLGVAAKA